ncbi:MAG: hypothetical protein IPP76_13865 [Moraxellaceae bacterium]|nr:hypothetical protein [Moraxellaceae bacterium]
MAKAASLIFLEEKTHQKVKKNQQEIDKKTDKKPIKTGVKRRIFNTLRLLFVII